MKFNLILNSFSFAFILLWTILSSNVGAKRIGEEDERPSTSNWKSPIRRAQSVSGGLDLFVSFELIDYSCFSSHTYVDVFGKGNKVTMDKVQVGDRILTGSGNYETVYSIDHRHPSKETKFLQIYTSKLQDEPLELTERHMVFLEGKLNPIPAASIRIGDHLRTLQDDDSSRGGIVTKISTVNRNGIFNPLTADGTIVANGGIIVSSYSAVFHDDEYIDIAGFKVMSYQNFFNILTKPYRFMCNSISLEFCKTNNELVTYSKIGRILYTVWTQQSVKVQNATLAIFMAGVYIINLIFSLFSLILGAIMMSYYFALKLQQSTKKKKVL